MSALSWEWQSERLSLRELSARSELGRRR